jgi:AAHS family 4-hydroxybenzoate transporter-like MFS transporter
MSATVLTIKKGNALSTTATGAHATFDIGHSLDHGPFSPLQKLIYALAAFALILDGFDGQMIGFAIPAIIKEWGITRGAFSTAVAAGLFGMAVGGISAGVIADRIGRRTVLIGSVFLFGACTFLIGFAPDVTAITIIRFFAGLGIGAALPTATTLTAEYTPLRLRTLAVTLTVICYPLGGMLAGLFASSILPVYGWRYLFWVGGLLPVIYSVVLWFTLKESPRYLAGRSDKWPQLRILLSKMSRSIASDAEFYDSKEQGQTQRASFSALFSEGRARDTLGLCVCFFMTLLSIYSAFSWLPTMLTTEGLSPSLASMGLTAYNLGGVIGAIICALAISRLGSRWPMIIFCALAAGSALLLKSVNISEHTQGFLLGLGVHGMFINAVQCSSYALCAHIYPTVMRVTGTATALSFGRFGAILSSFVGAAMITSGGSDSYLNLLGGSMVFSLLALVMIRNHIPAVRRNAPIEAEVRAA